MSTEVKNIVVALRARIGDFRKKMSAGGRGVTGFQKTTDRAKASVGNLARTIKRAALAAVAGWGIKKLIGEASRLQETMNKFDVVFGDNAKSVAKWGDTFAAQIGRSKTDIKDYLAGTQDLLVPMGFTPGSAEAMSKQITRLAVDLASFNNLQDADVLRDIQAALTGSGEVMKKYGVIVSQASINLELLNAGLDPKHATEAAKAQARMTIILAGTTAAQGDAMRSSGSFANQLKGMKAAFVDTAASLGTVLLPMATRVVAGIKNVVGVVSKWIVKNKSLVGTIAKVVAVVAAVVAGVVVLTTVASAAGAVFGALSTAVGVLRTALVFLIANPIVAVLVGIAGAAGAVAAAFGFMKEKTAEVSDEMQKALGVGDKVRATDNLRMERLKQLADLDSRNSDEMKESRDLVAVLTERYGDLGIQIDTATGKIRGLAGAQGTLNTRMKEAAVLEAQAAFQEIEQNLGNLRDKFDSPGWWSGRTGAAAKAWQQGAEGQDMQKRIGTMELRERAAASRLIALLQGDASAVTGGVEGDKEKLKRKISEGKAEAAAAIAARKKVTADAESAIKRLASLDEQAAAKSRTALQNQIYGIQQVVDERKRLLRVLLAGERAKKGGGNQAKIFKLEMRYYDVVVAAEKEKTAAAAAAAKKAKAPPDFGIAKRPDVIEAASKATPESSRDFGILARGVSLRGLVGAFDKPDVAIADNTARTADVLERMERAGKTAYFVE